MVSFPVPCPPAAYCRVRGTAAPAVVLSRGGIQSYKDPCDSLRIGPNAARINSVKKSCLMSLT